MTFYYFDLETTGLDPVNDKIISIQFLKLDDSTGKKIGSLNILKEWDSDESTIIKDFSKFVLDKSLNPMFALVCYNFEFKMTFLNERCKKLKLSPLELFTHTILDLRTLAVLMNKGNFKGTALTSMVDSPKGGKLVPILYNVKNFEELEKYVVSKSEAFLKFLSWAYVTLPKLGNTLG